MPRIQRRRRTHRRRQEVRRMSQPQLRAPAMAADEDEASSNSSLWESLPEILSSIDSATTIQEVSGAISLLIPDDNSQDENHPFSQELTTELSFGDILIVHTEILAQFILHKYKVDKLIKREDMLKIVDNRYFPEILEKTADRLEAVFAVALIEVDPMEHLYDLISQLGLPHNGRVYEGKCLPKTGLVMMILGFIFMMGNSATEEEVWEFLHMMQVYAGRKHAVYGEPKKLIKDLVKMKYLKCRRIANSNPPRYEFLWGSRSYQETSKMKVLEYIAKVNDTVPDVFVEQYEEALREEQELVQRRNAGAFTSREREAVSNRPYDV